MTDEEEHFTDEETAPLPSGFDYARGMHNVTVNGMTRLVLSAHGIIELLHHAKVDEGLIQIIGNRLSDGAQARVALRAAIHALRSYEFGNGAPDLAKSTADHCEAMLKRRIA